MSLQEQAREIIVLADPMHPVDHWRHKHAIQAIVDLVKREVREAEQRLLPKFGEMIDHDGNVYQAYGESNEVKNSVVVGRTKDKVELASLSPLQEQVVKGEFGDRYD